MEQITLGQIGLALTFIVGLIVSTKYIAKHIKLWISDSLKDQFKNVDDKIDKLKDQVNRIDQANVKNFLVSFLADAERGVQWDEVERERFWEQYEHYQELGGNSYIKNKVDKLKAEGKI